METNVKSDQIFFDKDTTNIIKGIALIMMLFHHFFTFPEWWPTGSEYPTMEKLAPYLSTPFKMCVPVFCFITGYFYFYNKDKTYKYSLRKITDILISYWIVFAIFGIIAKFYFNYPYTVKDIIKECFAISYPTMIFCWYVFFYIVSMLILPIVVKLLSRDIHIDLFLCLLLIPWGMEFIVKRTEPGDLNLSFANVRVWFPCIMSGYIFANYHLFEKLKSLYERYLSNKVADIICCLFLLILIPVASLILPIMGILIGTNTFSVFLTIIYAPLFIFALIRLSNYITIKQIKQPLIHIGKYSLLMWFVSCIFFGNSRELFQPILYFPGNPILVTIWGTILCFIPSYILDKGIKKIQKIKNNLIFTRVEGKTSNGITKKTKIILASSLILLLIVGGAAVIINKRAASEPAKINAEPEYLSTKLNIDEPFGLTKLPIRKIKNNAYHNGVWVELYNSNPVENETIKISGKEDIQLKGWACDLTSVANISNLYVTIGDTVIKTKYGQPRPDFATAFELPIENTVGFEITLPYDIVEKQDHIDFIMQSKDSSYIFEPVRYTIIK